MSNGELSGYRLIYVWTYYTERKEKGGGEGRGKKGIYIYKIYRVDPFLSAGVVSMRQLALLYMLVYSLHVLIRSRTHIYTSVFSYTYARTHPRKSVHTHAHDAYEHKVHVCAYARGTCTHAPAQCSCICTYAHARTRLHMRPHLCKHTPSYFGCALTDWGHTPQQ